MRLWRRLGERFWLKELGLTLAITVFMIVYFQLLEHPLFTPADVPMQPLDHWIPFTRLALWPYISLWVYVGTVPSLLRLDGEMLPYGLAALAVAVVGFAIFLAWPTRVQQPAMDWQHFPVVQWLKSTDRSGNACPSLHVAYAVLTCAWLAALLGHVRAPAWVRWVNVLWALVIVWSTIGLRQHVALDVEAGALLGGLAAWLSLRRVAWRDRRV